MAGADFSSVRAAAAASARLRVGGVRKPCVETKTWPFDLELSPRPTALLAGTASSVTVQPFALGVKRFSVPTTLSAMTATMLSEKTVTFCSDWRGEGVKTVARSAPMAISSRTGPRTPSGRDSREPAA
ncbi:hypothetical protein D3C85_1006500 [compost metagenome]